jgi:hypothetical protein
MTLPDEMKRDLDRMKFDKKLPQVCFFCRARLESKDREKTWKYIPKPNGKIVPACLKHIH